MHWIEEWCRIRCEIPDKPECDACTQKCVPKISLAEAGNINTRMIDDMILCGLVTHPLIANRIADFACATAQQRDMLVPEKYRGQWKPSAKRQKAARKKVDPETVKSARHWGERHVVLIDRSGHEKRRFMGAKIAAKYAGKGRNYIYSRCERRISPKTDEFARTEESFRWADEWDSMSAEERREDVRNRFREVGSCKCSGMPKVYEFQGERHTIAEWARITMMPEQILRNRIKAGWDMDRAVRTPLRNYTIPEQRKGYHH